MHTFNYSIMYIDNKIYVYMHVCVRVCVCYMYYNALGMYGVRMWEPYITKLRCTNSILITYNTIRMW